MPWASGVLRGSGWLPAEEEKEMSEIASIDGSERQLGCMAGCLAIREEGVKWERAPGGCDKTVGGQQEVAQIFNLPYRAVSQNCILQTAAKP